MTEDPATRFRPRGDIIDARQIRKGDLIFGFDVSSNVGLVLDVNKNGASWRPQIEVRLLVIDKQQVKQFVPDEQFVLVSRSSLVNENS